MATRGIRTALLAAVMLTGVVGLLAGPLSSAAPASTPVSVQLPVPLPVPVVVPADAASATLSLMQGLDPELTGTTAVDVLLDQRVCALRNVSYATLARRLSVPAGRHELQVLVSDGRCGSGSVLTEAAIDATSGGDFSVLLQADAAGTATLRFHSVDLAPVSPTDVRLMVHNASTMRLGPVQLSQPGNTWIYQLGGSGLDAGQRSEPELVCDGHYRLSSPASAQVTGQPGGGGWDSPLSLPGGRVVTVYLLGDTANNQRLVLDVRLAEGTTA